MSKMQEMMQNNAQDGRIEWIGVRPAKKEAMKTLQHARINYNGLDQDYRVNPGKRAVTLIQWEHLHAIASILGRTDVAPELLRRNIVVSGINLLGLRKHSIQIGDAVLKISGLCAPCSFMERTLGHGGFNAVRGHGGVTAEVLTEGDIAVGSSVQLHTFGGM